MKGKSTRELTGSEKTEAVRDERPPVSSAAHLQMGEGPPLEMGPTSEREQSGHPARQIGPYSIIAEIGRGGMGVVYQARDVRLGRYVAMKFLSPQLSHSEEAKARLLAEARAASTLDHAGICTVYDIGESEEGVYIAMAYYEGQALDAILERGPLTSQRQLISDISHEMRSPLARVNATLGVARQRLGQDVVFDRIERDTDRLNEMVGRLLTLARLDMTAASPEMSRIALDALVSEVVADVQFEAEERDCRVEFACEQNCYIEANPALVRSAVEDIIRNAIRYTVSGTAVEVRLECRQGSNGHHAVLRVSDRGPGVPQAELANIFRPFYRVGQARDRKSGGVGLGLAIAERVARVHGGSVQAENRPGGGLEVVLTLAAAKTAMPVQT
ncbi:MAG: hypothetical protein EHM23_18540 [Acidobacteria bacterium]|nr:MAG: hypothetical protein EHM23_18540 [Acidobacteriota bacterium]